jgi:hypothetical protein
MTRRDIRWEMMIYIKQVCFIVFGFSTCLLNCAKNWNISKSELYDWTDCVANNKNLIGKSCQTIETAYMV